MTEFRDVPAASEVSAPFWAATREQRLMVQRCAACDRPVWHPRAACPTCLGTDLRWHPLTGTGTVYAVSVHHRAPSPTLKERVPYVVALVELDDGPRMLSTVVGPGAVEARVGDRVGLGWEAVGDGRNLPVFERARP